MSETDDTEFIARLREAYDTDAINRAVDKGVMRAVQIVRSQSAPRIGEIIIVRESKAESVAPAVQKPGFVVRVTYAQMDKIAALIDKSDDCMPMGGDDAQKLLGPALAIIGVTLEIVS